MSYRQAVRMLQDLRFLVRRRAVNDTDFEDLVNDLEDLLRDLMQRARRSGDLLREADICRLKAQLYEVRNERQPALHLANSAKDFYNLEAQVLRNLLMQ